MWLSHMHFVHRYIQYANTARCREEIDRESVLLRGNNAAVLERHHLGARKVAPWGLDTIKMF